MIRWRKAVRNVAKLVDRVAGDAGEMHTLTERDMFAILDHEWSDRHLWAWALWGLRRGEIAGLRWANVDLNPKTVTVSENRMTVGKEIMTGTPKWKASTRTLPMLNEVAEGPRQRGVHAVGVRAQPGRRAARGGASFGRVVTTRDTETGSKMRVAEPLLAALTLCPHWDSNPDCADFKNGRRLPPPALCC